MIDTRPYKERVPQGSIQWYRDALQNAILMDDQEEAKRLRQKLEEAIQNKVEEARHATAT